MSCFIQQGGKKSAKIFNNEKIIYLPYNTTGWTGVKVDEADIVTF